MPKYVARARTDAPAEAVWPLVSDLTRHGEWSADPLTVTPAGDGVYESVARSKGKEFRARLEVLESVPPRRFAFRATDATGTYDHVLTLTPDGTGTVVTREIEAASLSVGQRLLFYAVLPIVKKPNARKALRNLAARAASG
ncbi:MAG TPA: SRPBCC family protein [Frankiaceae bacterium]|jgi:uncharacterized protein YndB with AHSA1/START domain|nr:SRPBCC family protein [Frankiaceae bacterium]